MLTIEERTRRFRRPLRGPPALQNGDRLRSQEFLRRYEAMPELKKAELIEGIVYMGSPVSAEHGEPDGLIHGWLWTLIERAKTETPYRSRSMRDSGVQLLSQL